MTGFGAFESSPNPSSLSSLLPSLMMVDISSLSSIPSSLTSLLLRLIAEDEDSALMTLRSGEDLGFAGLCFAKKDLIPSALSETG